MKLEVGQYYTVRNPKETGIIKVRVDAIRGDITSDLSKVAVSVFLCNNEVVSDLYRMDGMFYDSYIKSPKDLFSEYILPSIPYSIDLVGKRVRLRDRSSGVVHRYTKYVDKETIHIYYPDLGTCVLRIGNTQDDIVEIL